MTETLFFFFLFSFCIPNYTSTSSSNPNIRQIAYHLWHKAKGGQFHKPRAPQHHTALVTRIRGGGIYPISVQQTIPAAGQLSWVLHHNRILASSRKARRGGSISNNQLTRKLPTTARDSNIQVRFVQNGAEVRPILGREKRPRAAKILTSYRW